MGTLHGDGFTSDAPDLARSGRFTEPERGMTAAASARVAA
jgi:hypothetical protein